MSHYTRVATKIKNKTALVKALCAMGFKEYMIEVSDEKMSLRGYQGDTRKQKANIRIKGAGWGKTMNYVGPASNDLGFELQEDGTYAFHVSQYDQNKYNKLWQGKLLQQYGKEVIKEVVEEQDLFITEEYQEDGKLYINVESQF